MTQMEGCCYQHDHGSPESNSHFPCALDGAALGCFWRNRNSMSSQMVQSGLTLMDAGRGIFGNVGDPGWHCDHWVNTGITVPMSQRTWVTQYGEARTGGNGGRTWADDRGVEQGLLRTSGEGYTTAYEVEHNSLAGGRRLSAPDRSLWGGRRRRFFQRRRRTPVRRRRNRRRMFAWASVTAGKYSTHAGLADPAKFGWELTAHVNTAAADEETCPTVRVACSSHSPSGCTGGSTGNGRGSSGGWRLAPCRNTGTGMFTGMCSAAYDNWDSLSTQNQGDVCTAGAVGCCGCRYQTCPQSQLTPDPGFTSGPGMYAPQGALTSDEITDAMSDAAYDSARESATSGFGWLR